MIQSVDVRLEVTADVDHVQLRCRPHVTVVKSLRKFPRNHAVAKSGFVKINHARSHLVQIAVIARRLSLRVMDVAVANKAAEQNHARPRFPQPAHLVKI